MKRFLSVILIALMLFSIGASAAILEIDGKKITHQKVGDLFKFMLLTS